MNNSSEVRYASFDPVALGITEYIPYMGKGNADRVDKDYIIETKNGNKTPNIVFSMSYKTHEFVVGMYGESVSIGVNEKGQLFIWPGDKVTIVRNGGHSNNKQKNPRGIIHISGMRQRLIQCYGKFRRVYFQMRPYSNGDALVFTPTGEVDKND